MTTVKTLAEFTREDCEDLVMSLVDIKGSLTVHGATVEYTGDKFTKAGVLFAVNRGISESTRNVGAGAKGKDGIQATIMFKTGEDRDREYRAWAEYAGLDVDQIPSSPDAWDAFVTACVQAAMAEKLVDVYQGTVRAGGGGPRRSPDEKLRDEVIESLFVSALPDGSRKAWADLDRKTQRAKFEAWAALDAVQPLVAEEITRRKAAMAKMAAVPVPSL